MEDRLKLGSKMREIPLREEDRLKLADKSIEQMTTAELVERQDFLIEEGYRIERELAEVQSALRESLS
jgi:hypothetical protein